MTDAAEPQAETPADSEPLTLVSHTETPAEGDENEGGGAVEEVVEIVKTVVYALLIALVLRVFLFQPFTIPSASMEPNLLKGDYIIVSKYSYGYSRYSIPFSPPLFKGRLFEQQPTRGDIIVFKLPADNHTDYIKRLIGVPGDRIQVKAGVVYVNDKVNARLAQGPGDPDTCWNGSTVQRFQETNMIGRSYMTYDCGPRGDVDDTGVYIVPEGNYFFMGDNRDNSLDSRVAPEASGVGFVPAENLVGRARIILLSWNGDASLFKPWTWFLNARPSRFFNVLK
ncbi:MAG: signal peptidase I [Caulobacter sp.]|nr:signal peptidase I [Caulobacter sp.]